VTPYRVVFSPEAEEQLAALYRYIAAAASPDIAQRYTEAIITYCEGLRNFPLRGTGVMTFALACESPTTGSAR
jgi:toxin ParE1/3/4